MRRNAALRCHTTFLCEPVVFHELERGTFCFGGAEGIVITGAARRRGRESSLASAGAACFPVYREANLNRFVICQVRSLCPVKRLLLCRSLYQHHREGIITRSNRMRSWNRLGTRRPPSCAFLCTHAPFPIPPSIMFSATPPFIPPYFSITPSHTFSPLP